MSRVERWWAFLASFSVFPTAEFDPADQSIGKSVETEMLCDSKTRRTVANDTEVFTKTFPHSTRSLADVIRDLYIGLRVRNWVPVRLFNSTFQVSNYHNTYPFHPMSYPLHLKPTWRIRALETWLVWNSKIVLVLDLVLVLVVQSEGSDGMRCCKSKIHNCRSLLWIAATTRKLIACVPFPHANTLRRARCFFFSLPLDYCSTGY